jgi:Flp pilus assembly pilin Flp
MYETHLWHSRCPFAFRRAVMQETRDRISHTRRCASEGRAGGNVMTMLLNQLRTFAKDESGQDLLEYALLVALIALVAFGAVAAAGTQVNTIFTSIANQLKTT